MHDRVRLRLQVLDAGDKARPATLCGGLLGDREPLCNGGQLTGQHSIEGKCVSGLLHGEMVSCVCVYVCVCVRACAPQCDRKTSNQKCGCCPVLWPLAKLQPSRVLTSPTLIILIPHLLPYACVHMPLPSFPAPPQAVTSGSSGGDVRLVAALRYRLERKLMLRVCADILDAYVQCKA